MELDMIWHKDGHSINLKLEKSLLVIDAINCPHEGLEDQPCHLTKDGCAVSWFVSMYGLECNVGVAQPKPELEVAWTYVGDPTDGIASGQVWIIPVEDEFFHAWSATQPS